MKKCITSFLICFVFAFGVITAFGCRDEVYAVPSDAFTPFGTLVSGTIPVCDFYDEWGDEPKTQTEIYTLIEKSNSSSYAFLYHSESSGTLSVMVYSTSTVDCALHYFSEYNYSDNVTDEDKNFSPSSFSCSSNGYTYALSFSNYYFGHNWDTYNYSLPVVTVPDSYYYNPQAILNTVLDLDGSAGFEFTVEDNSPPEYSEEIGYLTGFSHQATQYIESESSNSDQGKFWDTYSWNLSTSTGYSIQPDDTVKLRLVCSYGNFARDIVEYDVSGDKSVYMVDRSDLLEQCDSIASYKDSLSFWEILTSGFGKSDPLSVVCYACVFTSDGRCGSWIRQDSTWNIDNGGNGYDPNVSVGNFDDDGNFVSDSDKGYVGGQGNSTYDPDSGILYSGVDNLDSSSLISAIKNLVDGVGQVPQIIALMFLWLPTWVLTFFSVCVAIWGLVLVKKAIFG